MNPATSLDAMPTPVAADIRAAAPPDPGILSIPMFTLCLDCGRPVHSGLSAPCFERRRPPDLSGRNGGWPIHCGDLGDGAG